MNVSVVDLISLISLALSVCLVLCRLQELTVCSEDNIDVHDIELIQYINVDCCKLKRLLQGLIDANSSSNTIKWSQQEKIAFFYFLCVKELKCKSFLLAETVFKFKALKKAAQLSVIYNLEKVGGIIITIIIILSLKAQYVALHRL